jgi:hypothetical protein
MFSLPVTTTTTTTVVTVTDTTAAIPDMCAIGIMMRGFESARDWLAANPDTHLAITPEVLAENLRGEELISELKPEFAAILRGQRESLFEARGVEVESHDAFDAERASLLANPCIGDDLRRARGFEMRMSIVALARCYNLPILSGNLFYPRLAQHVELPAGVYDILRDRWTVPASVHAFEHA